MSHPNELIKAEIEQIKEQLEIDIKKVSLCNTTYFRKPGIIKKIN